MKTMDNATRKRNGKTALSSVVRRKDAQSNKFIAGMHQRLTSLQQQQQQQGMLYQSAALSYHIHQCRE